MLAALYRGADPGPTPMVEMPDLEHAGDVDDTLQTPGEPGGSTSPWRSAAGGGAPASTNAVPAAPLAERRRLSGEEVAEESRPGMIGESSAELLTCCQRL